MTKPPRAALAHPLFADNAAALDRYQALLDEDQALRHAEYDRPDPARRRLRVMCNDCSAPWCCNQRVEVDLVEALVLYRWAARHAPAQLEAAIARGRELRRRPVADDVAFFRRRRPCPFLVHGRCSVYAVRPHGCRTHYMAGNPLKCRDELQPSETYAMDPDPTIIAELRALADDIRFFSLVESVGPREMAELLHFLDALPPERWKAPRRLDWE